MDAGWNRETARVAVSFDRVADLYREEFADELERKPYDRSLIDRFARRLPSGPVLEVGAGPGQVGARLTARGVPVVVSDVSVGQLREARQLDPSCRVVAADLARLPVGPGALAGIVAFYCLIFGPPEHLSHVFADWRRALRPGGLALIAVHAGDGSVQHVEDFRGRPVDVTIAFRDPVDLATRLRAESFVVEELTVRPPYPDESLTDRLYVIARRTA